MDKLLIYYFAFKPTIALVTVPDFVLLNFVKPIEGLYFSPLFYP